jgi:hypothetical protein
MKLKDRHFDTTEVIDADSKAVLNTSANTTPRMCLKKVAEPLGTVHTRGKGLLRG